MDVGDPPPDPEGIKTILTTSRSTRTIRPATAQSLWSSPGFDRAEVDEILDYLWGEDRIECWRMRLADGSEMLTGIRRMLEGHERRWGESRRYRDR